MNSIFERFTSQNETYDRVIIISDEQSHTSLEDAVKKYAIKHGTPYVYFINICGYGPTAMKPGSRVFRIYGYNADIYEKIPEVEINPDVVIDEINKINI